VLSEQLSAAERAISSTKQETIQACKERDVVEERADEAVRERDALQRKIVALSEQVSASDQAVATAQRDATKARDAGDSVEGRIKAVIEERDALQRNVASVSERSAFLERMLANARLEIQAAQSEKDNAKKLTAAAEQERGSALRNVAILTDVQKLFWPLRFFSMQSTAPAAPAVDKEWDASEDILLVTEQLVECEQELAASRSERDALEIWAFSLMNERDAARSEVSAARSGEHPSNQSSSAKPKICF